MQSSDFLGYFETTVSDLVSFSSRQYVGKLTGIPNKDCGEIIIVTEEVAHCRQTAEIQFHAKHLPKLNMFFSNDPFLAISRSNEDGSFSVVTKTDPVRSTQNPTWKPIGNETLVPTIVFLSLLKCAELTIFIYSDVHRNTNHNIVQR